MEHQLWALNDFIRMNNDRILRNRKRIDITLAYHLRYFLGFICLCRQSISDPIKK
jgi:hypothetical protein